jgi:hypothetical protein
MNGSRSCSGKVCNPRTAATRAHNRRQWPAAALSAGGQFAQAKDLVPYQSQDKQVRIADLHR